MLRGPTFASRSYFLNGRVWHNDPDPVYVRAAVPMNHARLICSWVTIAGDLNLCSEWLPGLPSDRMDLLKRTMPSHDLPSRPVDLFENDPPRIWLLSDDRHEPARTIVGLYNWTSQPLEINEPLARMGLSRVGEYVGFDYWANEFVPQFAGDLKGTIAPESCQVLSIRPASDHPQLIGTSRHITQGVTDVLQEKWNPATRTLGGISRVVAGDPYELRIVLPAGQDASRIESYGVSTEDGAAGVRIGPKPSTGGLRVELDSPVGRDVVWSLQFN